MLKYTYTFFLLLFLFKILSAQTITTSSITQTSVCAGGSLVINFTTTGTFNTGNVFTAELSNSTGSFTSPVSIGSTPLNTGIILGQIPSNTPFGINYRVRVVSGNPAVVGSTSPNPPIIIASNISPATITMTPDKPICNGDSINLSVSATLIQSYLWSDGQTTQSIYVKQSGSFYVKVTNYASCDSYSDTVTVTVNPLPVINLGPDIRSCKGDTVLLNAGAGFVKYKWNNGLDSGRVLDVNNTGQYYVMVTDTNDCYGRDTIQVMFNPLPDVSLGHDTSVCNDNFLINAGSGFLFYDWNNGLSHNQQLNVNNSGQYYVLVTDSNNCTNSDTINVSLHKPPLVDLGNDISICGNSISLDAGSGYSNYNWNNGLCSGQIINIHVSGLYYVVVTDSNDCKSSDTINVTVNELPESPVITQSHDTLFSNAAAGNQWYSISAGEIQNANNSFLVPPVSGYYYDIVTLNGCISDTSNIFKYNFNMIRNIDCYTGINIFPNPANKLFSIIFTNCNPQNITYYIENIFGQAIVSKSLVLTDYTVDNIDLSAFPAGIYFIKVYFENNDKTFKLLVR